VSAERKAALQTAKIRCRTTAQLKKNDHGEKLPRK
jgi:hypothetical protein